jgi:hypothetical protein
VALLPLTVERSVEATVRAFEANTMTVGPQRVTLPLLLMVAWVKGLPASQSPLSGVAVKVPLILDPSRKPFVTFPEIVNLRAVEVALSEIVPDDVDFAVLLAVEVKVPDALPEMHVRFFDVILMFPLTAVAGGLPAALQPLIENVAVTVCLPLAVKSTPGEMFAVEVAVVHVVSVAAGAVGDALAVPPQAAPPTLTIAVASIASPAVPAASFRVSFMAFLPLFQSVRVGEGPSSRA